MNVQKQTRWSANATLADAAARLREAGRIVVTTHAKPDGDAIGSSLSCARALRLLGKDVTVLYLAPWFERFDPFLRGEDVVRPAEGDGAPIAALGEPDAVLICDTGSWAQLRDAREWLTPLHDRAIVIDHHPTGDEEVAATRVIDPLAAAACEMACELCVDLLGVASARDLPLEVAEPLYLGLATDTGFFRYSNTTGRTMRLAADLLEAGVDQSLVLRISEQSDRPARLRLIARALSGIEFLDEGRIAVMSLSHEDFAQSGADMDDAGGLTDLAQSVASVRAVAVLTEIEPGVTKVSMRSKPPAPGEQDADVSSVARALGGGGHVRAAGVRLEEPLDAARARIGKALTDALK